MPTEEMLSRTVLNSWKLVIDRFNEAIAPLSDGPLWFERLHAREPNLMKIVLDPRRDAGSAVENTQR